MIDLAVDTAKVTKLKAKFESYGPYATKRGLEASNNYLNSPEVKNSIYPARSYEPFVWSSEKQRRAYFATDGFGGGIPYSRTMSLQNNGRFTVNETNFWIEYVNGVPYAKWVLHPSYQIIGHKTRRWPLINRFIVSHSSGVVSRFKPAALAAWEEMDSFMYGGGVGL